MRDGGVAADDDAFRAAAQDAVVLDVGIRPDHDRPDLGIEEAGEEHARPGAEGDAAAQACGPGDEDAVVEVGLVGLGRTRRIPGSLAQALGALGDLGGGDRAQGLGRAAAAGEARRQARPREHRGAGLDQHAVLHHRPVEDDDVVLDHDVRADGAGMNHRVAAHGDAVADDRRQGQGGDMDRGAVAEPEAVADGDGLPVRPDHAVIAEPGLRADGRRADDRAGASAPDRPCGKDRQGVLMG